MTMTAAPQVTDETVDLLSEFAPLLDKDRLRGVLIRDHGATEAQALFWASRLSLEHLRPVATLRGLRDVAGLTQDELAALAKSLSGKIYVSMIECGRSPVTPRFMNAAMGAAKARIEVLAAGSPFFVKDVKDVHPALREPFLHMLLRSEHGATEDQARLFSDRFSVKGRNPVRTLRDLRDLAGLTQRQLSDLLGYGGGQSYIAAFETGKKALSRKLLRNVVDAVTPRI